MKLKVANFPLSSNQMLDHFVIVTAGGLGLWSKTYTPVPSPVNALISGALIEERSSSGESSTVSHYDKDGFTIVYTLANELDLIFVLTYQRILQLAYVDDFILQIKAAFIKSYRSTIEKIIESTRGNGVASELTESWASLFSAWELTFTRLLREAELKDSKV